MNQILCLHPFYFMELAYYGKVYCCCPSNVAGEIGNIKDNSLQEIWNGTQIQNMRQRMYAMDWQGLCKPSCPEIARFLTSGAGISLEGVKRNWAITPELFAEIAAGKTVLESGPTSIEFSNAGTCNIDCIMCSVKTMQEDPSLVAKALEQVRPYLPKAREIVCSGGGDPLARPDTREMLFDTSLESYPELRITLLTNGLLLPRFWHRIKHHHFQVINISIDAATKETYERIRRGGRWEDLLEALRLVSDNRRRFQVAMINMTVMRENYTEMPAFIKLGEEYGLSVYFRRVKTEGDLDPHSNFFDENDQETMAKFKEILNACSKMNHSVRVDWSDLLYFID